MCKDTKILKELCGELESILEHCTYRKKQDELNSNFSCSQFDNGLITAYTDCIGRIKNLIIGLV